MTLGAIASYQLWSIGAVALTQLPTPLALLSQVISLKGPLTPSHHVHAQAFRLV